MLRCAQHDSAMRSLIREDHQPGSYVFLRLDTFYVLSSARWAAKISSRPCSARSINSINPEREKEPFSAVAWVIGQQDYFVTSIHQCTTERSYWPSISLAAISHSHKLDAS